jgi:GTP-binding protein Era
MAFRSGFVSILGRPNAGKSTLLNRMVGMKVAIVSDKPQTTRQMLQGVANRQTGEDGAQIVFLDTPGIHKGASKMNRLMMDEVQEALQDRDLLLLVVDASAPFGPGDAYALEMVKRVKTPCFLVLNKADLLPRIELLPLLDRYSKMHDFTELVPVSARTGDNVEHLLDVIVRHLPEGPEYFPKGHITDLPARFLAAEIIREKAILMTHQELPYSTAVIVDNYEKRGGVLRVHALVFVEKEGQKGILIGARGERLKAVATRAREEIEKTFGTRVYLEVFVKVRANWRESSRFLEGLDWRKMVGGEDRAASGPDTGHDPGNNAGRETPEEEL